MKKNKLWLLILFFGIFIIPACSYKKGDSYQYIQSGDTIRFIIRKSANGRKIQDQISRLRVVHTSRNDEYKFVYLSDSLDIIDQKAVLLSHSEMPDYEDDLLTKGYLGAFGTKEIVTYMIVTTKDFDKYFYPPDEK